MSIYRETKVVRPCFSSPVQLNPGVYEFILLSRGEAHTYHSVWSRAGFFGGRCGHTESWVNMNEQVQTALSPPCLFSWYIFLPSGTGWSS